MFYGYLYSASHRRLFRGALYLQNVKKNTRYIVVYIVTIFAQDNVGSSTGSYFTVFRVMDHPPLHHRSYGLVMTDIFTYILVCATMTHLRTVELLRSATFYEICDVCRARGISVVINRRQSPSLVQP